MSLPGTGIGPAAPGQITGSSCGHLGRIDGKGLTCTHAVAYNQGSFQRILDDIPDSVAGVRDWVVTHLAIDQYLNRIPERYVARPLVAAQRFLLNGELQALKYRFTL